jgi:hypothetical protein
MNAVRDFTERPQPDRDEIKRSVARICEPELVYEIRAPSTTKGTVSGYFDDLDALASAAANANQPGLAAAGVYVTVNPVRHELLARSANQSAPYARHTTSDADIARRCGLLVDLDSIRPAGISATLAEHEAALQRAWQIHAALDAREWAAPIVCDSGNGAHLIYPIDLPNDAAATALIKRVLEALALRFDDAAVTVDRSCFNAARIVKIPGTVARKGSHLVERPHRVSRIIDAGGPDCVNREQLEELATTIPDPPAPTSRAANDHGRASRTSLSQWIARHGIAVKREAAWNGGTRFILEACLFDRSHSGTSAALIERASGAKVYKCQHSSCVDKHWVDVRKKFEPDRSQPRRRRSRWAHTPGLAGEYEEGVAADG